MTCSHQSHVTPSHPKNSDFTTEWRRALRSKRFAKQRRRIRELRASMRNRPSASDSSMRRKMNGARQVLELRLLEGQLALAKNLLKIRGICK
jgi:hypothetical protein